MSRAQEIRNKRLAEKEDRIKEEAKVLYNWVLDMFENPTANNTAYEVYLYETSDFKIRIGDNPKKGITDKPFVTSVMKKLADMFQKEEGYTSYYTSSTCCGQKDYVKIRMNV